MNASNPASSAAPDVTAGVPLEPAAMLPRTQWDRRAGVTVTAEHVDGPPLVSFHIGGAPRAALLAACERIDAMGKGWAIVSISSPASVYRDLQGTRRPEPTSARIGGNYTEAKPHTEDPRTTELQLLGAIGRLDLLRRLPFRIARPA